MATKVDITETSLTAGQMSEFWRLVCIPGSHVNRSTFQAYIEGRNPFANKNDKMETSKPSPTTTAVQNIITVLPNLTLSERIALGKYDLKNSDITDSLFPHNLVTVGEWEYDLYHPNCSISSEDAKSSAEVDGWHVAEADHLLAFGAAFPDVQRKFPVIALGSVCEVGGSRFVLGLWRGHGLRNFYLSSWADDWGADCRFLRVRKVKSLVA